MYHFWRIHQLIPILISCISLTSIAQDPDSLKSFKKENIKTGFSLGGIPVVSYNSDIGFKYGARVNLYWFGDGSKYPSYNHSLFAEWSRTTLGNGINQITFESNQLIPSIRLFAEASYLTEKALDFYGYNGYQAVYSQEFENGMDSAGASNRLYYRHSRQLLRLRTEFQGNILGKQLRWLTGLAFYGITVDSVDIDKMNEGNVDDQISHNSLYGNYIEWGLIPADQRNGGNHLLFKGGLVYDTRDNEPNPFLGIWSELQLHYAPSFLSNTGYSYTRLILTHRQYFTLVPEWMSLACRISYQGKISGEMPFYMMPFMFQSAPLLTWDGIGGAKTVRGIKRNRVVGDGFLFGNLEVRGKILKFSTLNQNIYIALSVFTDAGIIIQKYTFDASGMPAELPGDLPGKIIDQDAKEVPHIGIGGGVHFVLNQNFVITVDYGFASKSEDGYRGLYMNMKYLF